MRALPIRWTFALTAAALVGFVLALFGAGTYLHLYQEQLEEVDLTIANAGRHITGLPEAHFLEQSVNELLRD